MFWSRYNIYVIGANKFSKYKYLIYYANLIISKRAIKTVDKNFISIKFAKKKI